MLYLTTKIASTNSRLIKTLNFFNSINQRTQNLTSLILIIKKT